MYTKVLQMMTFGTLALQIYVYMISVKGIKPNDETVSVCSLSLYNFDQNKSFNINNSIVCMDVVLSVQGCSKYTPGKGQIVKND